jgi:tryptophanyl-tRNA synthetase
MEKKGRILTGHRPTGPRHIGHLVGTLENWSSLQESYECFFLIADLHVLTTEYEGPERIQSNINDVLIDWLASGIDPERSVIVLQSAIPAHAQLALLFSMLVTVARLSRVPTYKEQVQQLNLNPSLGLLSYPVLQSADILVYKANTVPVGEDQLPHLELARAMHTSYGNTISLMDSPEETQRKVMKMYTDPTRIHATDPGHVEGNPVFDYLDVFDPDHSEVEELKQSYRLGTVGDIAVKRRLAKVLNEYLDPLRQRRMEIQKHHDDLSDILKEGTERARPVAEATLEEVKRKMGLRN